jgi:predicted RNA-binding Zn-ribbon protein involved in translation (DUF1610 family)
MNKYQKALAYYKRQRLDYRIRGVVDEPFKELVDKATPKKIVISKSFNDYACPECDTIIGKLAYLYKHCPYCGQAIDND